MPAFLAVFCALCLTTFLAVPTMGGGWMWDADNALGFSAFAGMLFLMMPTRSRRYAQRHEMLGYAVLGIAVAHALWFLLADGAALEYIKPGAPAYMWLGIVSLLALTVLTMSAIRPHRQRLHRDHAAFKYWHRIIAIVALGGAAYHIVASGFYFSATYQAAAFVALAVAVAFGHRARAGRGAFSIPSPLAYIAVSIAGAAIFAGIRNVTP